MRIKNALIFGEDHVFTKGDLQIENGKFTAVNEDEMETIDGEGLYAVPGFVDIHFHGCVGDDMCDGTAEALEHIAKYEASVGVTSICPATMTVDPDELRGIMSTAGEYEYRGGARLDGINMEGPFISEAKKGAQAAENIKKCNVELFREFQKRAHGLIKLVDLAPEEEGAMDFIEALKDEVTLSLAHTTADYDTAVEAFRRGASHVTHLYNAMPLFTHRTPGVIGAACDEECRVELICDNIHIHPAVVRTTFKMFGRDRIILISDSMRATGLEDGTYTLGGQDVFVKGNKATLRDGTIAGSVTNLTECVRIAVKTMGIPFEDAIICASENPAKEIGIYDKCGSICVGKYADFILMDKEMNVKSVYVEGVKQ